MTDTELGRLEQITDLHAVWESEAGGFTPWLAREENLKLLGDTIGLDLELEATEKDVGPFRADILCKDTGTGNWVLVENQLARTDHNHLGQLLTYAAGLKAATIVWIADRFTEEHRATLDWLNEITDDRFNFFGLEVELWRIGNSPIAPKFNVVGKPNDWSRTVSTAARTIDDTALTETQRRQLEFWTELRRIMQERNGLVKPKKPQPASWMDFAVGRSCFWLNSSMHSRDNWLVVYLVCGGDDAKAHFYLLERQKDQIEAELGTELDWYEMLGKKQCYIGKFLRNADPLDKSKWPQHQEWLLDTLEKFYRVFSLRVKALDASEYEPDRPEDE